MGFYVQDDFWEAMEEQPLRVQDEVLGALTRLFFTGDEHPPIKGVSKALFVAFRDRVLIAKKRSCAGKSKRDQNEIKPAIKTESKQQSKRNQNDNQNDNQNQNDLLKSESESKKEIEKENLTRNSTEPENLPTPNSSPPVNRGAKFRAPTTEEVAQYAKEANLTIDAALFCDHYASKGWKVGKSPMKDWKAAARNWDRRDKQESKAKGGDLDEATRFYAELL